MGQTAGPGARQVVGNLWSFRCHWTTILKSLLIAMLAVAVGVGVQRLGEPPEQIYGAWGRREGEEVLLCCQKYK